LIKKLLVGDPNKRLNAGEALNHEWFKMDIEANSVGAIDYNILMRLQTYKGVSKLKKAAMNMLVKMADSRSIEVLRS
jgi:serine/threonine protein kinase